MANETRGTTSQSMGSRGTSSSSSGNRSTSQSMGSRGASSSSSGNRSTSQSMGSRGSSSGSSYSNVGSRSSTPSYHNSNSSSSNNSSSNHSNNNYYGSNFNNHSSTNSYNNNYSNNNRNSFSNNSYNNSNNNNNVYNNIHNNIYNNNNDSYSSYSSPDRDDSYNNNRTHNTSNKRLHEPKPIVFVILIILIIIQMVTYKVLDGEINGEPLMTKGTDTVASSYYSDFIEWISDEEALVDGMKYFYAKTGIKPYLALRESMAADIDGVNPNGEDLDLDSYGDKLYDIIFNDDTTGKHVLVLYVDDIQSIVIVNGSYVESEYGYKVRQSLMRNFNENWKMDISNEELFSSSFRLATDTIKPINEKDLKTYKCIATTLPISILILIFVTISAIRARKRNKRLKLNDIEIKDSFENSAYKKVVEKPIEEVKNSDIEELKKKYDK